jgi:membrane-bound lytic murein transglycosylase B
MSRELIELSPGQLHKLADLIHRQEVEKLKELKFQSYAEQQKYLNDAKDARDKVYHILESTQKMVAQAEADKDATKQGIAKDVYDYCTKGIKVSLQFIRSYSTRLKYLDKLKSHSDDLIKQLRWLDPATQQKEAQRLALEANMYKKATLEYAKKYQHFIPNQFTKWLKENKIKFEDLVQKYGPTLLLLFMRWKFETKIGNIRSRNHSLI